MTEKIEIISGSWNRVKNWVNTRIRIPLHNTFIGEDAGKNTTGNYNNFMGYQAGYSNISGLNNNFMGYKAGYSTTGGYGNNYVGYKAGYGNIIGHYSVCIGNEAGFYETVGSKLFIDDRSRTNEADGRIKALIYGVFAAATGDQRLSINGQLLVREVATYANDADAGTGGLVAGEFYKHADGSLHIKL